MGSVADIQLQHLQLPVQRKFRKITHRATTGVVDQDIRLKAAVCRRMSIGRNLRLGEINGTRECRACAPCAIRWQFLECAAASRCSAMRVRRLRSTLPAHGRIPENAVFNTVCGP